MAGTPRPKKKEVVLGYTECPQCGTCSKDNRCPKCGTAAIPHKGVRLD